MNNTTSEQMTDVLIVGGGLVGASLALALSSPKASKSLKISLVEATPVSSSKQPSFDDRSTVLAQSSVNLFTDLGVWSAMKAHSAAIEHIHTSDKGRFGISRLHAKDYQLDAMGYVVDNRSLGLELYAALENYPNIEHLIPAQVVKLAAQPDGYLCHVEQEGKLKVIQAKLVVLCDGGRSTLAQQLALHSYIKPYNQAALIANIELDKPHNGWAFERFTPRGPVAMLPLKSYQNKPRAALVWTTPIDQLDRRMSLSDKEFLQELQQEFGYRLGRFNAIGERVFYPLKLQKVDELIRSRLAILGNAAHALHPVAGQGFNLALRGAFLLAYTVRMAFEQKEDIGSYEVLNRYASLQQADRDRIQNASDALISIFGSDSKLLGVGRNLGILALDNCPLIKTVFARSAMGIDVSKPTFRPLESESV